MLAFGLTLNAYQHGVGIVSFQSELSTKASKNNSYIQLAFSESSFMYHK